ncbi:MAG: xanthine dehydrogenase small subunit [Pseudomonadota bacterium]
MEIRFRLNGEDVTLDVIDPTVTLLDWLRETRGLTGTKEGCNEGDCGACSVMVTDAGGAKALNACILFMPQLDGCAVRTVEGIAGEAMHPVQEAMVTHHASQCGFCTPGFVVSMATAHLNGRTDHADQIAGNLCRCTGYAPILRAAHAAQDAPVPEHMRDTAPKAAATAAASKEAGWAMPTSTDALATLYADDPNATLVAGATDVGLWVTKQHRDLGNVIFLKQCRDLAQITETDAGLRIGAGVTIAAMRSTVQSAYPALGEMLRRYGSEQVRQAATIGGNIANGSPIGDTPPALIAMNATLQLRHRATRRDLPLEDFFVEYGKQDRAPGEFVESITIPHQPAPTRIYKLSKRFDQDISAVCGAFRFTVEQGLITQARIAFGGMAGTPKRARRIEAALEGRPLQLETLGLTDPIWEAEFTPLSDARGSAAYRLEAARNMLRRAVLEDLGASTSVLEVSP